MKTFQYTRVDTIEIEAPDDVSMGTFLDWLTENDDAKKAQAQVIDTEVAGFTEISAGG